MYTPLACVLHVCCMCVACNAQAQTHAHLHPVPLGSHADLLPLGKLLGDQVKSASRKEKSEQALVRLLHGPASLSVVPANDYSATSETHTDKRKGDVEFRNSRS